MVAQTEIFFLYAERVQKVAAVRTPIVEPFKIRSGLAEKFKFHLLELSYSENEVTRRYFVPERFADLTYAERDFFSRRSLNVLEVDENALRGLGTEIKSRSRILGNTLERFEHEIEFSDIREIG